MKFSHYKGRKLWSLLWNKENLIHKKQRYLLTKVTNSRNKLRIPKALKEGYVPESITRSDELSCENVRAQVEKCFLSYCSNNQSKNHVVENHLNPFDLRKMANYENALASLMSGLSNSALYAIASIAANKNNNFEKTRPKMRNIIKALLPDYLSDLNRTDEELYRLMKILKNPSSYLLKKPKKVITPVTPILVSSINKILEGLDELNYQELVIMHKKLRGMKASPTYFPPKRPRAHCNNTNSLLNLVKTRCNNFVSGLEEGQDLPKELAKGISVIILSQNYRLGHINTSPSEFYPFSEEIISMQIDILRALWLLEKLRAQQLEKLKPILDPNGTVPRISFRTALRKYLFEYLFQCDEIDVPSEALQAIALLNGRPRKQLSMFSRETREREVEAVLNVSSHLKTVCNSCLSREEELCEFGTDKSEDSGEFECCESNDFEFSGTYFDFNSVDYGSGSKDIGENSSGDFVADRCASGEKDPKLENFINEVSKEVDLQIGPSKNGTVLNEICDETAIVAHKLIGQMLDTYLQEEREQVGELTRSYLRDGSINVDDVQVMGCKSKGSKEKMSGDILVDAVKNVLPSLPKSCVERFKALAEI